jgi:hypothetical protein
MSGYWNEIRFVCVRENAGIDSAVLCELFAKANHEYAKRL